MKRDFDLAVGQIACAETALQYLKAICKNEDLYTDIDARRYVRHARLTLDKVKRILSEPMESEDIQPQLQQADVSRSAGCYKADKKNWCLDESEDMSICQKCGRNVEYIDKEQTYVEQCFNS